MFWCSNKRDATVPKRYTQLVWDKWPVTQPARRVQKKMLRCVDQLPARFSYVLHHPEDFILVAPPRWDVLSKAFEFLRTNPDYGRVELSGRIYTGPYAQPFCRAAKRSSDSHGWRRWSPRMALATLETSASPASSASSRAVLPS